MPAPVDENRAFRFGVFELDAQAHELRKRGLKIKLGGQAFQVLVLLLERSGEVVKREHLRQAIWPGEEWGDHDQRLNKALNKIREALSDSADTPRYVETLPRLGYRFIFPVSALSTPDPEPQPHLNLMEEPLGLSPAEASDIVERSIEPAAQKRWKWIASAGAAVVVFALAGWLFMRSASRDEGRTSALVPAPATTFVGREESPSFGPDGKQLVFSWNGGSDGAQHLYIMTAGVGGANRVTDGSTAETAPVWSPDGHSIAFRRGLGDVWLVRTDGSGGRRLTDTKTDANLSRLAWSLDSKAVIVADAPSSQTHALFAVEAATGERWRLTSPPSGLMGDGNPAVSFDGRKIAFLRSTANQWRDIYVADLDNRLRIAGEPRRLTDMKARVDALTWTPDGSEIVFSAATPAGGLNYLYRIAAAGGAVRDLASVRVEGYDPAIAPVGRRLVFSRKSSEPTTIQKVDLAGREPSVRPLLSSNSRDYSPDISPDGEHVVMSSGRSGTPQLWVFRKDGTSPRQITFLGNAGASVPRWSWDGASVVFESRPDGQPDIFVTDVASGAIKRITQLESTESRGSFARDGQSVYFGSATEGRAFELYRVSVQGGSTPERLTRGGGLFGVESPDGKYIYYTTPDSEIRRMPREGGPFQVIARGVHGRSALCAGQKGLYYLSGLAADRSAALLFLPYGANEPKTLLRITKPVHNAIALAPDESYLLYTEMGLPESDLFLIENFR